MGGLVMGMRLALFGLVLAVLAACGAPQPELIVSPSAPTDVEALALGTWIQFLSFAEAHADCIDGAQLEVVAILDHRATYSADGHLVTVKIPRPNRQLQESLIHELAHHVEACCTSNLDVRPALTAAAGLPVSTPWFEGPTWAETPSERFAEATIEVMLGSRSTDAGVVLSPEELAVVASWWRGDDPSAALTSRAVLTSPQLLAKEAQTQR